VTSSRDGSILYIRHAAARRDHTVCQHVCGLRALSDRMKAYLDGLTAVHDGESTYAGYTPITALPIGRAIRAPNIRSRARIR